MRISDWSSDVCSSDLAGEKVAAEHGVTFCQVDVLSDESADAAFAKARAANGQERILVNCAGGGNSMKTAGRDRKTGEIRTFRSEEHTSELQSLMRTSYAVFCLKKKTIPSSVTKSMRSPLT